MEPELQAREMIAKFQDIAIFFREAKRCAFLAVELIEQENIENNCHKDINGIKEDGTHITNELYWGEVKKEISKI